MDAVGFVDAMHAMADAYDESAPGEPSDIPAPDGGTEKPVMPPIPADPTEAPGDDWVWGGPGAPGTEKGSWHNPDTKEILHPDFHHDPSVAPHWDYTDPLGLKWRIFPGPDGPSMEPKERRGKQKTK